MNELLNNINRLRELVSSVDNEKLVSLHFFSEAFDLVYGMQEALVELESKQIERLKQDMEMRRTKLAVPRSAEEPLPGQCDLLYTKESGIAGEYVQAERTEEAPSKPGPIVSDELFHTVREIIEPQSFPFEVTAKEKKKEDIRKLLSLNDRFRFQRELFDGNTQIFNEVLDALNSKNSYVDAVGYIHSQMDWSDDAEITVEFYAVLERFYSA